ncbi:uncharacterized protein UTRI_00732_B [Ustilago trichophora]|uniref:Mitochondrial adapter protein MCP1 transmembrane domain-containing protein n=1 Tax=Ustilago trichophora TaxID=86804 RepID=A0A5C3DT37_9BASI|nr:uncharacterized protein UTRI_00732_B [Ustilago trichophora]
MVTHILGLQLRGSAIVLPATHRRRAISLLTRLQSASAAALAAFAVVHLSAPLVGLLHLGGDVNDRVDAVSRWMLLGRVAYQSGVGEVVLWASLATHVIAGIVKRVVTRFTVARSTMEESATSDDLVEVKKRDSSVSASTEVPKIKLSIAQTSGYILAPFAIHHAFVNRILPSASKAPISRLSPSELDYSFVSHSLSHPNLGVRIVMAGAYTILISAFAVHAAYAVPALLRSLPKSSTAGKGSKTKRSQAKVSTSLAVVLLASLAAIVPLRSSDRLAISSALKGRYDAVLRLAFPTRLLCS